MTSTLVLLAFALGLLLVAVATQRLLRRRARRARVVELFQMTAGCRAFNAYRMAGDRPGLTWDGQPIPTWTELYPKVRRGWAAFAEGLDVIDAYDRYRGAVGRDVLDRPMAFWPALDRATQARWTVAFNAMLDADDGDAIEDETDSGPPTTQAPSAAVALLLAISLTGCGWTWARVDHVASELDAACRDHAKPLTGAAVAAGLDIADASTREPDPEAAAASVADKVKAGAHTVSAVACVVARIAAIFGTLSPGEHPKPDAPRPRIAVTAQRLAALLAQPAENVIRRAVVP